MATRPNILILMDDEHRPDVLGYAGNDVVRTPVLDGLAADACVFENAYTPSPRCVPARQCIMAGELPMTCGCYSYGCDGLDADTMTYARRCAEYGYRTALAGKGHFIGDSAFLGYETRIGVTPNRRNDIETKAAVSDSRPRWADDPREGKWSDEKEIRRAGVGEKQLRADRYTVTGATQYIENEFLDTYYDRANPEQPTLLTVSLTQPHYPYLADQERFEYYLNRVEPYMEEPPAHKGLIERQRGSFGAHPVTAGPGETVTEREALRATAAYYAMVESVDQHFGSVLDTLAHVGEDIDEWIVIFMSDHGEMLGEHGIWEKGAFYEASAGVPLFIRWPEQFEGRRIQKNVSLCDVFATLCDLADIPMAGGRDSRSLVSLLKGEQAAWERQYPRDEVIAAEDDRLMIKWGAHKYIYHPTEMGGDVLFDLAEDAAEQNNVVDTPAYADTVAEFRSRASDLGYGADGNTRPDGITAGYQ
jgi:choline-sulfatase